MSRTVFGWEIECSLDVDAAFAALRDTEGFSWRIRENDTDGRYVSGRDARGVDVRVLGESRVREVEFRLPVTTPLPPAEAAELPPRLLDQVLDRLGASVLRAD